MSSRLCFLNWGQIISEKTQACVAQSSILMEMTGQAQCPSSDCLRVSREDTRVFISMALVSSEAMASMLPHWRGLAPSPMSSCAAWEEIRLVLGEFSSWVHVPPGSGRCRFFWFCPAAVRSYTLVSWLFFPPPERTTSLKYCPVPQEGFLAGCRFLSYWCPGLAGVLLNLKILSILTLLALSRVKVYKWRGKSNYGV